MPMNCRKNVSAVYELYLDDVDWSGSKKLHRKRLKKEQYQALRSLILDQDIEWDVLFDLFQKENCFPECAADGGGFSECGQRLL